MDLTVNDFYNRKREGNMSDLRQDYLECISCGHHGKVEEPATPESLGWEDTGEGFFCPGCLTSFALNWELLVNEQRLMA